MREAIRCSNKALLVYLIRACWTYSTGQCFGLATHNPNMPKMFSDCQHPPATEYFRNFMALLLQADSKLLGRQRWPWWRNPNHKWKFSLLFPPKIFIMSVKNQDFSDILCTSDDRLCMWTAASIAHGADLLTTVYMLQVLQNLVLQNFSRRNFLNSSCGRLLKQDIEEPFCFRQWSIVINVSK